eukprot:CAMPEP_0168606310 /NCGR_PEP_ID=MMETSP0420-20121227/16497_1 /TAXON_ID=498008 /ORGANISM="Pessonella sp." /LENGTH=169 /DNA_ID=CAMNT_0008645955 /DNA_START=121 /DNA_END=626 /DNA_ORIENTATION=-
MVSDFEGVWHKGVQKGVGVMRWPNGDTLAGVWHGDEVSKAKFTKGTSLQVDAASLKLLRLELAREEEARRAEEDLPPSRRTHQPPVMIAQKWTFLQNIGEPISKLKLLADQIQEKFSASNNNGAKLNSDVMSIVLNDTTHPLGQAMHQYVYLFKSTFHFSYGDVERQLA